MSSLTKQTIPPTILATNDSTNSRKAWTKGYSTSHVLARTAFLSPSGRFTSGTCRDYPEFCARLPSVLCGRGPQHRETYDLRLLFGQRYASRSLSQPETSICLLMREQSWRNLTYVRTHFREQSGDTINCVDKRLSYAIRQYTVCYANRPSFLKMRQEKLKRECACEV